MKRKSNPVLKEYARKLINIAYGDKIMIDDDKEVKDEKLTIGEKSDEPTNKRKPMSTLLPGEMVLNTLRSVVCIVLSVGSIIVSAGIVLSMSFEIGKEIYKDIDNISTQYLYSVLLERSFRILGFSLLYLLISTVAISVIWIALHIIKIIYCFIEMKVTQHSITKHYDKISAKMEDLESLYKKKEENSPKQ
jgi:cell division protein FtsL